VKEMRRIETLERAPRLRIELGMSLENLTLDSGRCQEITTLGCVTTAKMRPPSSPPEGFYLLSPAFKWATLSVRS
jgi:hypothetical protein